MTKYLSIIVLICMVIGGGKSVSAETIDVYPILQQQLIADWGYDVKQGGKAKNLTPLKAQALFVDDGMTLLRVSIWGTGSRPAHPAEGIVIASYYQDELYAMTNARKARPDVKFFASKKLDGMQSFPAWVKDNTGIIPEKYARLVADYLEFFEAQGFVFDVLGIDNEDSYNEGQITANPWRHKDTIDHLRVLATKRGFHLPLIIGPEDYGPKPGWMREMVQKSWGDRVDIVGTHYYPRWRPMSKLLDMLQYAGDRPIWHSEVHWDNMDHADVIVEAELALATIFDCFDVGFTGMAWWAYTRSGIKGDIEKTLVRTTVGHRPIDVVDFDGTYAKTGKVITRAFRAGSHIALWLTNNTDRTYSNVECRLPGERLTGRIEYVLWTAESTHRNATIPNGSGGFNLTIQPRSVYCMEMTWDLPQALAHYRFDGNFIDSGSAAVEGRVYGQVNFTEGKVEQAVMFASDYGQVAIPHIQKEDMSLSFWIKTSTTGLPAEQWDGGTVVLSSDTVVRSQHIGISLMEGRVAYGVRSLERETTILSETAVNDNQWYLITAIRNEATGELVLYIDGQFESTAIGTKGRLDWASDLILGTFATGNRHNLTFQGSIDDFRLYDRMLSSSEVAELYEVENPPPSRRSR